MLNLITTLICRLSTPCSLTKPMSATIVPPKDDSNIKENIRMAMKMNITQYFIKYFDIECLGSICLELLLIGIRNK